ncbi:MAG: hypothetical protein JWM99_2885 [Verrucomicrobiales bacterium]|nr:hypothetical protein [Verrucomicrobiales bacterium]
MNRVVRFILWSILGLTLLICGLFIPAHFRAVDSKVLELAGKGTLTLSQAGANLLNLEQIGPARMLWRAAEVLSIPNHEQLGGAIAQLSTNILPRSASLASNPNLAAFELFESTDQRPVIELLMERKRREPLLDQLEKSRRPGVRQLLRTRTLTNTVEFPPVASTAGQPLDAIITLAAILSQTDHISAGLREKFELLSIEANSSGKVEPLESAFIDLLALGKRLTWQQLSELLRQIQTITELNTLAEAFRNSEQQVPMVYSALFLSDQPAKVTLYLTEFPKTGLKDIQTALFDGKGALLELLHRQQRIYSSRWRLFAIQYDPFAAFFETVLPLALKSPLTALLLRCLTFLLSSLCLARAIGSLAFVPTGAQAQAIDGTRLAQETVIALSIFAVAIVAIEPFIVSEDAAKKEPVRYHIKIPGVSALKSQIQKTIQQPMSIATLTPLLIFFVLQGILYIWSLSKLSEIRRQQIEPRIKLRLLENEDHLFDAGLYLGFAGTVISLIMVSMGIITQSIMAAYASTSFGIIFVSILKIFHIRPLRRQLIMESEEPAVVQEQP